MIGDCLCIRLHQQVEAFVVAYEAEEEENGLVLRQVQVLACLRFGHCLTEIIVQRVGIERYGIMPLGRQEHAAVFLYTLRHRDEAVYTPDEITDEPFVPEMRFVGDDIIEDGDHANAFAAAQACDRSQTGRHQRNPELNHQQFDAGLANSARRTDPSEWIDAVHCAGDGQIRGLGSVRILGLSGEQEVRVLHGEREDLHLVAFCCKLPCQALIERC